jgi:hypothetical protein
MPRPMLAVLRVHQLVSHRSRRRTGHGTCDCTRPNVVRSKHAHVSAASDRSVRPPGRLDRPGGFARAKSMLKICRTKKPFLTFINLYSYDADVRFFSDYLYRLCRSPRAIAGSIPRSLEEVVGFRPNGRGGGRHCKCRWRLSRGQSSPISNGDKAASSVIV